MPEVFGHQKRALKLSKRMFQMTCKAVKVRHPQTSGNLRIVRTVGPV